MRTWILLALLGLVLLISMRYREGTNDTLTPAPTCAAEGVTVIDGWCKKPDVPSTPPVCPAGSTFSAGKCRGGSSMTATEAAAAGLTYDSFVNQYVKPAASTCPAGYTKSVGDQCVDAGMVRPVCSAGYRYDAPQGKCVSTTTDPSESIANSEIDSCNIYWNAAISKWAAGNAATSAASSTCLQYAPSWIRVLSAAGNLLDSSGKPTPETKAQAIIENNQATEYAADTAAAQAYSGSTGYADLLAAVTGGSGGGPPPPMDESPDSDVGAVRPTGGTVYTGPNSPYTGQAGTGQGSAFAAAAGMTGGSTYGSGAGYSSMTTAPNTGLASGPTVVKPSTNMNLQVGGPKWGGLGAPVASGNGASSITGPTLYGPTAAQNKNIETTNWMPSYWSVGSDWNNMFAGTSRVPGDQDLIPNPYLQSMSYSLANGSLKTDPVPFLTDFSAFQS